MPEVVAHCQAVAELQRCGPVPGDGQFQSGHDKQPQVLVGACLWAILRHQVVQTDLPGIVVGLEVVQAQLQFPFLVIGRSRRIELFQPGLDITDGDVLGGRGERSVLDSVIA